MTAYAVFLVAIIAVSIYATPTSADESVTAEEPAIADEPLTASEQAITDEPAILALPKPDYKVAEHFESTLFSFRNSGELQQFDEIIGNGSLTIAQIASELKQWLAMQVPQVQAFCEYVQDRLGSMFADAKEKIANSTLSDSAKQAFADIANITVDFDQTIGEKADHIKSVIESLPEEVRNEMADYVKSSVHDTVEKIKEKLQ